MRRRHASRITVVLRKAAHSGPCVSASESPLPTSRFLSRSGSRRELRALALRPLQRIAPSRRLWRSSASSSWITWACSKGCRPAFQWVAPWI